MLLLGVVAFNSSLLQAEEGDCDLVLVVIVLISEVELLSAHLVSFPLAIGF